MARTSDVFDCDHAFQLKVVIHHKYFFNSVLMQLFQRFFPRRIHLHCYQLIFGCHDAGHRFVFPGFETDITLGHDANQTALIYDG